MNLKENQRKSKQNQRKPKENQRKPKENQRKPEKNQRKPRVYPNLFPQPFGQDAKRVQLPRWTCVHAPRGGCTLVRTWLLLSLCIVCCFPLVCFYFGGFSFNIIILLILLLIIIIQSEIFSS